ncbi:MAG: AI-2E family transporter [Thermodesulfobacteriota bacterium]
MAEKHQLLLERIAVVTFFLLIAIACFKIILPFLGPILWSVIIVVATWPLYLRLKNKLGSRSKLATLIMTIALSLVLVLPLVILTVSLSEQISNTRDVIKDLSQVTLPENPPAWISKIPIISTRLEKLWHEASTDMHGLVEQIRPQIRQVTAWLLAQGAHLGLVLLQFVLVLVISAVLYGSGEAMAGQCRKLAVRLGGDGGLSSLEAATQTIKKVSLGVICTAAIQAILSGFGFWLASVPGWVLLTFFCFFLAMLQVGTGLIWIPVSVWLFYQDANGWAIFTIAWGIFINIGDNFIKPLLISHGGKLPIALIFLGVIGGLLTWGFIGIFLGPTLLAIGYNLLHLWLEQEPGTSP